MSTLLLALLLGCPVGNPARAAIDAAKAEDAAAADGVFSCPMHPEVAQDHAGKCPKCGMDLVRRGQ